MSFLLIADREIHARRVEITYEIVMVVLLVLVAIAVMVTL
jgi:hypothetical protein